MRATAQDRRNARLAFRASYVSPDFEALVGRELRKFERKAGHAGRLPPSKQPPIVLKARANRQRLLVEALDFLRADQPTPKAEIQQALGTGDFQTRSLLKTLAERGQAELLRRSGDRPGWVRIDGGRAMPIDPTTSQTTQILECIQHLRLKGVTAQWLRERGYAEAAIIAALDVVGAEQ